MDSAPLTQTQLLRLVAKRLLVIIPALVALIFSHVFINIGMNIRLMPVTGVPLPLLSYGGSSVLGSLIAMGILQNVYFYRRTY